jgi:serine/threonine-protein kinase
VVALLVLLAIAAGALFALTGNDTSSTSKPSTTAAKKSKRSKAKTPAAGTPAQSQPAPTTQPAPTAQPGQPSSYQVPQPTGNDPAAGSRLNTQGKALSDAGNYSQAIPVLERAVQSYPAGTSDIGYAYALFNLGHALLKGGRPADAVPVLEERLKNPDQNATVQQELDAARAAARQG